MRILDSKENECSKVLTCYLIIYIETTFFGYLNGLRPLIKSVYQNIFFLFLSKNICCGYSKEPSQCSDFIWDFRKLPFPSHLGKYFNKIGKISAKIHEIGKIKAIFGLGMTPIYGLKNGQIKPLQ